MSMLERRKRIRTEEEGEDIYSTTLLSYCSIQFSVLFGCFLLVYDWDVNSKNCIKNSITPSLNPRSITTRRKLVSYLWKREGSQLERVC